MLSSPTPSRPTTSRRAAPSSKRAAQLGPVAHDDAPSVRDGPGETLRLVDERRIVENVEAVETLADRRFVHEFADDDVGHAGPDGRDGRRRRTASADPRSLILDV